MASSFRAAAHGAVHAAKTRNVSIVGDSARRGSEDVDRAGFDIFGPSTGFGKSMMSFERLAKKAAREVNPTALLVSSSPINNATNLIIFAKIGIRAKTATTGRDAFRMYRDDPDAYSMLVAYTSIQDFSFIELINYIRDTDTDLPIIGIGEMEEGEEEELLDAGCDHVFPLPLTSHLKAMKHVFILPQSQLSRTYEKEETFGRFSSMCLKRDRNSLDLIAEISRKQSVAERRDRKSSAFLATPLTEKEESKPPSTPATPATPPGNQEAQNQISALVQKNKELTDAITSSKEDLYESQKRLEKLQLDYKQLTTMQRFKQSQLFQMKLTKDKIKVAEFDQVKDDLRKAEQENERLRRALEVSNTPAPPLSASDEVLGENMISKLNQGIKQLLNDTDVEHLQKVLDERTKQLNSLVSSYKASSVVLRKDIRDREAVIKRCMRETELLNTIISNMESTAFSREDHDANSYTIPEFVKVPILYHDLFNEDGSGKDVLDKVMERIGQICDEASREPTNVKAKLKGKLKEIREPKSALQGLITAASMKIPAHLSYAQSYAEGWVEFASVYEENIVGSYNSLIEAILSETPYSTRGNKKAQIATQLGVHAISFQRKMLHGYSRVVASHLTSTAEKIHGLTIEKERLIETVAVLKEKLAAVPPSNRLLSQAPSQRTLSKVPSEMKISGRLHKRERRASDPPSPVLEVYTPIALEQEEVSETSQGSDTASEEVGDEEQAEGEGVMEAADSVALPVIVESAPESPRVVRTPTAFLEIANPDFPDLRHADIVFDVEGECARLQFGLPPQIYEGISNDAAFTCMVDHECYNSVAGIVEIRLLAQKKNLCAMKKTLLHRFQTMAENTVKTSLASTMIRAATGAMAISMVRQKRSENLTTAVITAPAPYIPPPITEEPPASPRAAPLPSIKTDSMVRYVTRNGSAHTIKKQRVQCVRTKSELRRRGRRWQWGASRQCRVNVADHARLTEEAAHQMFLLQAGALRQEDIDRMERSDQVGSLVIKLDVLSRRLLRLENDHRQEVTSVNAQWEARYASLLAKVSLKASNSPKGSDHGGDLFFEEEEGCGGEDAASEGFVNRVKGFYFSNSTHAAAVVAAVLVLNYSATAARPFLHPKPPKRLVKYVN